MCPTTQANQVINRINSALGIDLEALVANGADVLEDSRRVASGDIFLARSGVSKPGLGRSGQNYVKDALARGARFCLIDSNSDEVIEAKSYSGKAASAVAIALKAKRLGFDLENIKFIAVTGTNGKTSVSWYLAQCFSRIRGEAYYNGTLGCCKFVKGELVKRVENILTTPSALEILSKLDAACPDISSNQKKYFVIEASSHAISQRRLEGLSMAGAIFTNLTRDHMDYHCSIEEYKQTKFSLFNDVSYAVINLDDSAGEELFSLLEQPEKQGRIKRGGVSRIGHTLAQSISTAFDSPLLGEFNRDNLLLVIQTLVFEGIEHSQIMETIKHVTPPPGRLEVLEAEGKPKVIIDYAHTPDALLRVCGELNKALQEDNVSNSSKLLVVFGCGGDRDSGKRSLMVDAVSKQADLMIMTADNPRSESQEQIFSDMLKAESLGAKAAGKEYFLIADRREAISKAFSLANEGDIVLIAGKGHENYQEINGQRNYFSDKDEALSLLNSE